MKITFADDAPEKLSPARARHLANKDCKHCHGTGRRGRDKDSGAWLLCSCVVGNLQKETKDEN